MTTEDFVKIPAELAAEIYSQYSAAGQSARASELHQAYLKRHRVNLKALATQAATEDQAAQAMVSLARSTGRAVGNSVRRVFGNWKTCEHCQSKIKAAAIVCRYCQRDLA